MPFNPMRSGQAGSPPFVKPFLQALSRMQARETLRPDQLSERARSLLEERFGPSIHPVEVAFSHGGAGLLSEHTHYFEGFAVLMPLPLGTAVAVRVSEAGVSRLVFEGSPLVDTFDRTARAPYGDGEEPFWVCVAEEVVRSVGRLQGPQLEISVVSTVPWSCSDAYLAALGVSIMRAVQKLLSLTESSLGFPHSLCACIAECTGRPFSLAYLLAADVGDPSALLLVDTATREHLPLEAPSPNVVGWGLVGVGSPTSHEAAFYRSQKAKAEEALEILQHKGFGGLTSFRELEHRDLQRALDVLPRSLRPVVRFLVSENRRVQKLVAAVRRRDWQMLGALLLMSHASQRNDWGSTSEEVDFVVEQVEGLSMEGMYGASMTSQGGSVLVAGQPFSVPHVLDRIQTGFEARFGRSLETFLL